MKSVVRDIHAHGWLIAPNRLHVLSTDYRFTTLPAMKAGLDKFWTLKNVDLPWKPQTVFIPLSRQLLDGERGPGVGDVVELTGRFEPMWLRQDNTQTDRAKQQCRLCLHTIQRRLHDFNQRFDKTYRDWRGHVSWFHRANHIQSLADVDGFVASMQRLIPQVGSKIQVHLTRLLQWLRQQQLTLQRWLDAHLTRAYCFVQTTKPNAHFSLVTPPVPKELAFHRMAIDQRSVDASGYQEKWLHALQSQAQNRIENRIPLLRSQMVDAYHWHEALAETYEQLGVLNAPEGGIFDEKNYQL